MKAWQAGDFVIKVYKPGEDMMLNRTLLAGCCLSVVLFVLNSCMRFQDITETPPTILPTETERIPVSTPSMTALPPSSVSTAMSMPPLSKEDASNLLFNLLQDNSNCQLPCWWGLVPGRSTPLDAYEKLIAFSSIAEVGLLDLLHPTGGVIYLNYPKDNLLININVGVQSDSDKRKIEMIQISTQALHDTGNNNYESVYGAAAYNDLLGAYSLANILSRYGPPSQVFVRADIYSYTQSPETFEITLLYLEKGIFVRYNALAERIGGDIIRGCPSKAFVELWLLSPDDKDSYKSILLSKSINWEAKFPYSKLIEDASSMTDNEFYQVFKNSVKDCLETPLNIWPEH